MGLYQPLNVVGGSFAHGQTVAGPWTVVALASNVNGMILRHFAINTSAGIHTIYVGAGVPGSTNDVTYRMIAAYQGGIGGMLQIALPLLIPAGLGIYGFSSAGGSYFSAGYDLL